MSKKLDLPNENVFITENDFTWTDIGNDHQDLMNQVYTVLQSDIYKGKNDRISVAEKFSPKHKLAVVLGNFNYQVGNGGIHQWIQNGYATEDLIYIDTLMKSLIDLKDRLPESLKEQKYIETIIVIKNCVQYLIETADPTDENWRVECTECDDGYYDDEGELYECDICNGTNVVTTASYVDNFHYDDLENLEKRTILNETTEPKMAYYNFEELFQLLLDLTGFSINNGIFIEDKININLEIIKEIKEIASTDAYGLNAYNFYNNIKYSTGTLESLSEIFVVPKQLIEQIKNSNITKDEFND